MAKGRRDPDCDWEPELGLAILRARTALYIELSERVGIPNPDIFWSSHEAIGAFMGISDTAVQHIERIALRKLRVMQGMAQTFGYGSNGNTPLQTH